MPKFEKGNKASKGRPRGSLNKTTRTLRERIEKMLGDIDVEADIISLSPSERVKLFVALAEFVLPKMQRTAAAVEARFDIIYEGQGVHRGFKLDGETKSDDDVM